MDVKIVSGVSLSITTKPHCESIVKSEQARTNDYLIPLPYFLYLDNNWTIISVSVSLLNLQFYSSSLFFSSSWFPIIPLWTKKMSFNSFEWGCAFLLTFSPQVAHLVWAMPILDLFAFFNTSAITRSMQLISFLSSSAYLTS